MFAARVLPALMVAVGACSILMWQYAGHHLYQLVGGIAFCIWPMATFGRYATNGSATRRRISLALSVGALLLLVASIVLGWVDL